MTSTKNKQFCDPPPTMRKNEQEIYCFKSIAAFHAQRPENYSICLSGQKFFVTIFFMKTDLVKGHFQLKNYNCKNNMLVK